MASEWRRKWARLTTMDSKEIRSRMGQALSKRLDLALYRFGLELRTDPLRPLISQPKFFLGRNEENGVAHRAELLRKHLPEEAKKIIREADNICRHEFHLLGYEKLEYGSNIDWHSDPVHGKRAPLKPWFQIDFLNFDQVGDHKIIWELNRHQHLVILAKAWCLTRNQAYASELAAQWYSWQKANPYPFGVNWASTLEVAFRGMSWVWVRNLMEPCPDLPASFQSDLAVALHLHGRYTERYLSTYFSPNTHLIGEAFAMFFVGTLCPEISAAERWRSEGWRILREESERQVRSDGVYFEQALYYHVYALDFFLYARYLASVSSLQVPDSLDHTLKKMLDVVQSLSAAGAPEGFGDDDGGRVFNPRRNRVEHMTDPLALGAIIYEDEKYARAGLTEEAIWLFGDKAVEVLQKPHPPSAVRSRAFEAGGIYLINDLEPRPQQMMIDAGPQGTGHSGHGHADALSIRFSVEGHRFLVDPGAYTYVANGPDRDAFRGTAAHNTLRVDSLDQAVPQGPFAWSSIPRAKAETWVNGQTFDLFVGSHDGYRRLTDPVLHRRTVFHVKGGLWFVHDEAEGNGTHLLESFWHFAPEVKIFERHGMILATAPATDGESERPSVALLLDRKSTWTTEISEGFVSPAYGTRETAPVMRMSTSASLPQDCGVLLVPMVEASELGTFSDLAESPASGAVRGFSYQTKQGAEFLFVGGKNSPWKCGVWASDAQFLYCRLEGGRFAHVIMVSGSFAEWQGKRFLTRQASGEAFEWSIRQRPGELSADGSLSDVSVVSNLESFDSVS